MWIPLVGFLIGIGLGIFFPLSIAVISSKMLAIVSLSVIDSIFFGFNLKFDNNFKVSFFTTSFVLNTIIGIVIVYLGSIISTDLFIAVAMVFCAKIFYNLSKVSHNLFFGN